MPATDAKLLELLIDPSRVTLTTAEVEREAVPVVGSERPPRHSQQTVGTWETPEKPGVAADRVAPAGTA